MNVLRVCPFSRLSSCESASKGIKCLNSTYGGLVHTSRCSSFSSSGTSVFTEKPFFLSCLSKNVSAPLCSCSGAQGRSSRGHKKPRRPSRHIGTALGNELRSSSALPTLLDVAPFPSHRRSRLLMRHSRNALVTIRHRRQPGNRLNGVTSRPGWAG